MTRSNRMTVAADSGGPGGKALSPRDSTEQYHLLAELSTDMMFVIDRRDTIIYANPAACRALRRDHLRGVSRAELFHGEADAWQQEAL